MFRRVQGSRLQFLHKLHRASQGRNRFHAQVSRSRLGGPKQQPAVYFRAASQQRFFSVSQDLNDNHEKDQASISETNITGQEIELTIKEPIIENPSRKEVILEAFGKTIDQNVQEILSAFEIDESQDEGEELINLLSDTHQRSSLRKRWQARMTRGKRDRIKKLSKRIERNRNISVDDAWDQMLQAANIPYVDLTNPPEQTDAGDIKEDSFPSTPAPDFLESTDAVEPDTNDRDLRVHENDLESGNVSEDTMHANGISLNERLLETDANDAPLEDATANTDTELNAPLQTYSKHEAEVTDFSVVHVDAEKIKMEAFADAIEKTLALLAVMDAEEWIELESDTRPNEEDEDDEDLHMEEEGLESDVTSGVTSKTSYSIEIDDVHDLIVDASAGNYVLTTLESNLLLARLVTSTDVSSEVLLDVAMQIYFEMKTLGASGRPQSAPDATTYQILILALSRRFQAKGEAVKLFQEMMSSSSKLNPEAFLAGMQACYERSEMKIARQSMQEAMHHDSFQPSVGSYLIFLDMLKYQNLWKEALDLLRMSLKDDSKLKGFPVDKLLISMCRWPMRTRSGQLLDTSSLLLEILELLEQQAEDGHKPGFSVWATLIDRLSKAAKHDESLWSLVQRAFRMLLTEHPDRSPSMSMLKIGLKTCEATTDAELAAQLVSLIVSRSEAESSSFEEGPPLDSTTLDVDARSINVVDGANEFEPVDEPHQISPDSKVPPTGAPIPIQELRKAFEISLGAGDMSSASSILSSFDKLSPYFPLSAQTEFYALGLLGFAKAGEADNAKNFLLEMKRKEMKPSEELYGAVMQSLAANGRSGEARELFDSMDSGLDGDAVKPGLSCYNALLLSHVRSGEWNDALAVHETMKQSEVTPGPSTIQGLLLASHRLGGQIQVQALLNDLLASKVKMDRATFQLAMKMLVPGISRTTRDVRQAIRSIGEEIPELRTVSLDLIKSMRIAEVEQQRKTTAGLSGEDVQQRREESWRLAMGSLIHYANTAGSIERQI